MRKALAFLLAFALINVPLLEAADAAAPARGEAAAAARQYEPAYEPFSADQLDNLLAPIALYPDPLLAQVLLAATFADQVDEAARYVRAYGQYGVDNQNWDVSVKSVAHYPTILYMMADKLDWTIALGQAYVNQSTDVMSSVQHLRAMARAQGNLVTTAQQEVVFEGGLIYIWPAQARYIYLPIYDPYVVYYRRWPGWGPVFISFTIGFVIGAWLNYDCDWRGRRIFYTGWSGRGWIARSRPHVRITNVYVNARYRNVYVNRNIVRRNVNFYNLNRYNSIHRGVNFDNRARTRKDYRPNPRVNNQVIQRNINTGNPQLDRHRGRQQQPPSAAPGQRPAPRAPAPAPPPAQRTRPSPPSRPTAPSGARPQPQPRVRTQPRQQPQQQARPQSGAFNRGDGGFSPRASSQRGQSSRSKAQRPQRSAPQQRSQPKQQRPAPSKQQRPQGRSR